VNVAHLPANRSNGWFCGVPLAKRCSRLRSGRAAGEDHRWRGHAHQVRRTIAVWRDPYTPPLLSYTRACGRPRVSKTGSRSQGMVDIGCHSVHGMVCGRPPADPPRRFQGGAHRAGTGVRSRPCRPDPCRSVRPPRSHTTARSPTVTMLVGSTPRTAAFGLRSSSAAIRGSDIQVFNSRRIKCAGKPACRAAIGYSVVDIEVGARRPLMTKLIETISPSLLCAGAKDITAKPTPLTPPARMLSVTLHPERA
jgi:hypothetical protein